jgi:hypothetical protein
MNHTYFNSVEIKGGIITGTLVAIKHLTLTMVSGGLIEFLTHSILVGWDACWGGFVGLLVIHYGRKVIDWFENRKKRKDGSN